MQREIRFRAWDKATNEMIVEGFHVFGEYTLFNIIGQYLLENALGKGSLERYNDVEVMQFTGLKDKNGKEIYEGDILRLHNEEEDYGMGPNYHYRQVFYKGGAFCVDWEFGEYDRTAIGWALDKWGLDMSTEVIGNIHENPELLTP